MIIYSEEYNTMVNMANIDSVAVTFDTMRKNYKVCAFRGENFIPLISNLDMEIASKIVCAVAATYAKQETLENRYKQSTPFNIKNFIKE